MKVTDIELGMRVEVVTDDRFAIRKGEVGNVLLITSDLPYPIEVDFGWTTEYFKPEDLEEY